MTYYLVLEVPVCKKCRNYIMKFPCPHCGSELSISDRAKGEIQPIIPTELQGDFDEPPPAAYIDGQPEMRPSQTKGKKLSPDLGRAKTSKVKVSKHDFSSNDTISRSAPSGTADLITSSMDQRLTNMETTLKTLTEELNTIMKSQKVMEAILTKINTEIMKLRNQI
jgi:hypothetical protein